MPLHQELPRELACLRQSVLRGLQEVFRAIFFAIAGNVKCEVVGFMRKLLNGGYHPWAPKSGAGYVDVDDVAAAHTLAMLTPQASGRSISRAPPTECLCSAEQ
jgi:nucleoside-diphosphate-sugar epimerase